MLSLFLRQNPNPNLDKRGVKYIEADPAMEIAKAPMASPRRDLSKEKPVSDQIFQAYRGLYNYDKMPLNATVESIASSE
jgi:hypothetical protein